MTDGTRVTNLGLPVPGPLGDGAETSALFVPVRLGPDGTAYVGVLGGLVAFH